MQVAGPIELVGFEVLASDPSALWKGRFWLNSTSSTLKWYDGTTTQVIAVLSGAEFTDLTFFVKDNADGTKKFRFEASSISTGTTRVFTVPNSDGEMVLKDLAQLLKNKKLEDATTEIVDDADNTKIVKFQVSGVTTGTTRTLTVPDLSGTLALADTAQLLSNKQLQDSTTTIVDQADNTKAIRFEASGITAGNTRVLTAPDQDGIIAVANTAQTLTNKKLDDNSTTFVDTADNTKAFRFEASSITPSTTRIVTVPDTDGELVFRVNTQILNGKTFDILRSERVDDAATGASQTLTAPSKSIVRLTNAGLSSIAGVPAVADSWIVILNRTGVSVGVQNENAGATAANRIITGTNADITLANNAALFLVYDGSSSRWQIIGGTGSGTGGGDTSFKVDSIATNVATLKGGSIILDSGKELYLSSDINFNLKTAVNNAGVTAPSATTQYYLYVDLAFLPAQTSVGTSDRKVYVPASGTSGAFIVLATKPESTDLSRYLPLTSLKTDGSSDYVGFDNLAMRRHQQPSVNVSPLIATVKDDVVISSAGTSGQFALGHVLDVDSFPASTLTPNVSAYNFSGNANDANTTDARNLTGAGGITFAGADPFGGTSAASLDGVDDELTSTNAYFDPGDVNFSVGGMFFTATWTTGTKALFGQWQASNHSFLVRQNTTNIEVIASANGTTDETLITYAHGFTNSTWHHIAIRYKLTPNTFDLYVDKVLVASGTLSGNLFNSASDNFRVGSQAGTNFFSGRIDEFFFTKLTLNDEDHAKLASAKIDLTSPASSVRIPDRIWRASYKRADTFVVTDLAATWLLDQKASKLYVDFGDASTDKVTLKLYDGGLSASTVPVRTYDNTFTATPGATIAHGLPDVPTHIAIIHNELADGKWAVLDAGSFIKADATNLYTTGFGALTIDATHPLRIVASIGKPAIGVSLKKQDELFKRTSVGSVTVISGDCIFLPFFTISSGHTYTIDSGAALAGIGSFTVNGSLTLNGSMNIAT